jgi:predicted dithiol-disulfide oxidoreductase (DUF899 family)
MRYGQLANESEEYRKMRAELHEAEIALRDQRERVAELRRSLPIDTNVDDYLFHEGPSDLRIDGPISEVHLSELFEDPQKPLIIYQFMYGGAQKEPCPMCTMWIDGFNGIVHHLRQRANFAIVAQAETIDFCAWGRQRDWKNLRLVSSADTSFKTDLNFQDAEGNQFPGVSVIVRSSDGSLRHFYSASAIMKENEYRGLDLYTPVWSLLDLTPQGRGDWYPSLQYD